MKDTIADVRDEARRLGLKVETWAPGDGCKRYEFSGIRRTYKGAHEAMVFLEGYRMGMEREKERSEWKDQKAFVTAVVEGPNGKA